jgi:hypothetical protein
VANYSNCRLSKIIQIKVDVVKDDKKQNTNQRLVSSDLKHRYIKFNLDLVYGNIDPVYCSNRDSDTNNLVY